MKTVVINASGGGTDTGISGNGLVEKNVTLEISNIIKNILESKGVNVYMLRSGEKTISYDDRIKDLKNNVNLSEDDLEKIYDIAMKIINTEIKNKLKNSF